MLGGLPSLGVLGGRQAIRLRSSLFATPKIYQNTVASFRDELPPVLSRVALPDDTRYHRNKSTSAAMSAASVPGAPSNIAEFRKMWEAEGLAPNRYFQANAPIFPKDYQPDLKGHQYYSPQLSFLGPNAISGAADQIAEMRLKKVLFVTDPVLEAARVSKPLHDAFLDMGLRTVLFDKVTAEPTTDQVLEGAELLVSEQCDVIVGFGGGSNLEVAKGIAIIASQGGNIEDYEGFNKLRGRVNIPVVDVATTAGSGSEVSRFAVLTDPKQKRKLTIADWRVIPRIAVSDPLLHVYMPPALTASTGMDAMTHAVEANWSTGSFPATNADALHAMRLIEAYLPGAYANGNSIRDRDMMSYGAHLAGRAFNSAGLGLVHAMSHALGAHYTLPHGVCNGVLLPIVAGFNAQAVPVKFVDMARAMEMDDVGRDEAKAIDRVVNRLRVLALEVMLPENLRVMVVNPEDFPLLAQKAVQDPIIRTNPIIPTESQIVALYDLAYIQTY